MTCLMRHGSGLCQWLWPKLLRAELAEFMEFRNGVRMRIDKRKPGLPGMSRNEAFSMPLGAVGWAQLSSAN